MNRTLDIFLMKILLKKRFVGFVNSAWDPLITSQKKNKNNEMQTLNVKRYIQTNTKQSIIYIYIYFKNVKREY